MKKRHAIQIRVRARQEMVSQRQLAAEGEELMTAALALKNRAGSSGLRTGQPPKNLQFEIIKLTAKVDAAKVNAEQKIAVLTEQYQKQLSAAKDMMTKAGDGEDGTSMRKLVSECEEKFLLAKEYLENLQLKLAELHRRSAQAGSAGDLAAAQSVLTDKTNEMNKAAVKDWKEWVRNFNTIAGQTKRAAGRQNA